ncbi:hypothetical protein FB567DRAFT_157272 [Paraphoma chrysanthemicola]|uniref:Uncharacterized protein n=1 Tax=Paraphoma chrysanthemicola TaxID=798071 RepID=A0A8K0VU96_9PLEO|nr:hypothetical protein FB567DRAFT_157272 [Paraphoma chrysanthemicola]
MAHMHTGYPGIQGILARSLLCLFSCSGIVGWGRHIFTSFEYQMFAIANLQDEPGRWLTLGNFQYSRYHVCRAIPCRSTFHKIHETGPSKNLQPHRTTWSILTLCAMPTMSYDARPRYARSFTLMQCATKTVENITSGVIRPTNMWQSRTASTAGGARESWRTARR